MRLGLKMKNAQIFSNAHIIAKSTRDLFTTYRAAFSAALITIYAELRAQEAKPVIKSVFVHWSEGGVFNVALGMNTNFDINKEIAIDEYERLARIQALESNEHDCYDKVKVDVILSNGERYTFRHDINLNNISLVRDWARWCEYCEQQANKKAA